MKTTIPRNSIPSLLLIPLMLACFAFLPTARAVKPPDGGYPGANTAEGNFALQNLSTGNNNTAIGASALAFTTSGSNNTAVGNFALNSNTADNNTATGSQALADNTIGTANTATGFLALGFNTTGHDNTAIGFQALNKNTGPPIGSGDVAGTNNTATGSNALYNNTTGHENTATGFLALYSNNASDNTAYGSRALYSNIGGNDNTALGAQALLNNTEGGANTAIGSYALFNNAFNPPLYYGNNNTAVGFQALYNNIEGTYNIALGAHAGDALNFFSYWNIDIGNGGVDGESNTIRIGTPVQPDGWFEPGRGGPSGQSRAFIAGIRGVKTDNDDAIPVVIDSAGQLGTMSSSARFKTEIKPMDNASEAILALKPVTFHYKSHKNESTGRSQFGLIAEDVAKVSSDLVVRDADGEIYTVRYEAVNAMLLNEFLKEHRTVQELKKEIAALTATVQKVTAQVEMSRPAPQTVVNNH